MRGVWFARPIVHIVTTDLEPAAPAAPCSPRAFYLPLLGAGTRPTMATALDAIPQIVAAAVLGAPPASTLRWEQLRYAHTQAIRAALLESPLAPGTVNKYPLALTDQLKQRLANRLCEVLNSNDHGPGSSCDRRGAHLFESFGAVQQVSYVLHRRLE